MRLLPVSARSAALADFPAGFPGVPPEVTRVPAFVALETIHDCGAHNCRVLSAELQVSFRAHDVAETFVVCVVLSEAQKTHQTGHGFVSVNGHGCSGSEIVPFADDFTSSSRRNLVQAIADFGRAQTAGPIEHEELESRQSQTTPVRGDADQSHVVFGNPDFGRHFPLRLLFVTLQFCRETFPPL
jgi:hypothetical protein